MLTFILFSSLLIAKIAADCPPNSTEWNSSCFSFYANSTGFADAELTCKKVGGHLAAIHDGFTNALLAQEANKYFHQSTDTDFWIGATDLMGPNVWNWTDGTNIDFTDWKKGEPQNISGSNCASLSVADGYWTSQDCFKPKPFVCNVPALIPATTSYPITANCSDGWTYFAPTHACYGVNRGGYLANWTAAENYCESNAAHLPSIHSYAEFAYVISYLYVPWKNVWTGIYSPDSGVNWKTSDGTEADFLKYGKWCVGAPRNVSGETCVSFAFLSGVGCYYNYNCVSDLMNTLCKKPLFE